MGDLFDCHPMMLHAKQMYQWQRYRVVNGNQKQSQQREKVLKL